MVLLVGLVPFYPWTNEGPEGLRARSRETGTYSEFIRDRIIDVGIFSATRFSFHRARLNSTEKQGIGCWLVSRHNTEMQ